MKHSIYIINGLLLLLILSFTSCTKTADISPSSTAFTIVNAIVGSSNLVTNFNSNGGGKILDTLKWYNTALQISYGSCQEISSCSGVTPISLSQITDTMQSVYSGTFNLPTGSIHTLFMIGTVEQPDTLFTTDHPPYHPLTDSSVGIRFVNLSPGSSPVSVDLQGQPDGSEVASLSYKAITSFKNYAATYAVSSYIFEFRDVASGTLLSTYTMNGLNNAIGTNTATNNWRFRNVTIALKGLPGGAGSSAQGTFLVNNY